MKNLIGFIVLLLICAGLGFGLISVKNNAAREKQEATDAILTLSNKWVETSDYLDRQKQVNALLEKDLESQRNTFGELTNTFTRVSANLSQTAVSLTQTEAALKATQQEVAQRDAKIAKLVSQNEELDKQALDLTNAITTLTAQISATQKKLATSEGDKAFLEKELKRLMGEKSELERQFNDLAVLRAQVSKLKEELNIARRIEWIRQGLFANSESKGAQKLMTGLPTPKPVAKPNYDLNVEVSSDGSVKVVPPVTNSPSPAPQGR